MKKQNKKVLVSKHDSVVDVQQDVLEAREHEQRLDRKAQWIERQKLQNRQFVLDGIQLGEFRSFEQGCFHGSRKFMVKYQELVNDFNSYVSSLDQRARFNLMMHNSLRKAKEQGIIETVIPSKRDFPAREDAPRPSVMSPYGEYLNSEEADDEEI